MLTAILIYVTSKIEKKRFRVYFVRPASVAAAEAKQLYVVVPLTKAFREEHEAAWRRLTKAETFRLHLYDEMEDLDKKGDWYVALLAQRQASANRMV